MISDESPYQISALVADPSISPQSQKNGTVIEPPARLHADTDATAAMSEESKPAIAPPIVAVATDTALVIAPHSALAGAAAAGQAISSPPAAASSSRDTLPSSFAGGVSHSTRLSASSSSKMLFSDLYKSTRSPLARLRPQSIPPPTGADYDADLVSKDKVKNKEAVKKYLAERIRNDWEFKWPPATTAAQPNGSIPSALNPAAENAKTPEGEESNEVPSHDHQDLAVEELDDDDDDDDDSVSTYSTASEDTEHFKSRLEWWSDLSDDDSHVFPSAYRFDTPDAVGPTVQATALAKRAKRRRAVREEEAWNSGLACFNARRDAWTNAKTARVKPKPSSTPTSPLSPSRRLSFFRFVSTTPPVSPGVPLSPTTTRTSGDTTAVTSSDGDSKENPSRADPSLYPVETLLPLAPPLLPRANPMRASITPATYPSLYDRIVVHSLTPSCPVNLADVLRSCVVGWKRDGEWPPRSADAPAPVVAVRKKKQSNATAHSRGSSAGRRMSLGFLGRRESAAAETEIGDQAPEDGNSGGKGIRRSIQRVLGIGHERSGSNASNPGVA
ncbi:hypothetical protein SCARD494_02622 [Seiridium cardinale]